jgi:hypothetical protein
VVQASGRQLERSLSNVELLSPVPQHPSQSCVTRVSSSTPYPGNVSPAGQTGRGRGGGVPGSRVGWAQPSRVQDHVTMAPLVSTTCAGWDGPTSGELPLLPQPSATESEHASRLIGRMALPYPEAGSPRFGFPPHDVDEKSDLDRPLEHAFSIQ